MKKNQVIDLGLTGYDELFMNDQERADIRKPKVEEIPLTELTPFKDHPFKVKNDEEMTELMKSIADSGVLAPALARPKDGGGYELISGHRRLAACSAGISTHGAVDDPYCCILLQRDANAGCFSGAEHLTAEVHAGYQRLPDPLPAGGRPWRTSGDSCCRKCRAAV